MKNLASKTGTINRGNVKLSAKIEKMFNHIYCMDCLAEYLGCTVEELLDKIEEFKEEGCKLFE